MIETKQVTILNFDELYVKFGPMVLRRCRFLLGDEEQALDVMQDVFVKIFERREKMSTICSSFFFTVATNLSLNRIRSNKIRYTSRIDYLADTLADERSLHEKKTDTALFLDYIFAETKEDTRLMAVLHYVDGLTLEETAKELNMSVSGVRKRLTSLRKRAGICAGE